MVPCESLTPGYFLSVDILEKIVTEAAVILFEVSELGYHRRRGPELFLEHFGCGGVFEKHAGTLVLAISKELEQAIPSRFQPAHDAIGTTAGGPAVHFQRGEVAVCVGGV